VLRRLLKLATVFTILLGCYLGYVRAFSLFVAHLGAARRVTELNFNVRDSQSKREAVERASEAFGRGHWTAADDLQLRYFNPERGFWMYSKNYQRVLEEDGVRYDGRRLKLSPAAIIWKSRDGSGTKTVTSDEAIIDFNHPLGFNINPDSDPIVVRFARLVNNVVIRDDRGTPNDPSDDLVGQLNYVEYDDESMQVRSESEVLINERDTRITGVGLLIQLRPRGEAGQRVPGRSGGFEGAQSANILRNVNIRFTDVGRSGILPGAVRGGKPGVPEQLGAERLAGPQNEAARITSVQRATEPVPLDLRCDGAMQIDLPRPVLPVKVGPPPPPAPTLVHFTRNVVVRRGNPAELPDQLNCDNLDLTLVPADRATDQVGGGTPTAERPSAGEERGMFGDLALRRAKATGHAVWLQLPAQGAKIRCNELIHDRLIARGQNRTYFRGDPSRKLLVEKFDYTLDRSQGSDPPRRRVESVTHIWTTDATLFDELGNMDQASLVARGPGLLEIRAVPPEQSDSFQEIPADRTASWQDQLVLKNDVGNGGSLLQRILLLKGQPKVTDRLREASLRAEDTVVVWLKPQRPSTPSLYEPISAQGSSPAVSSAQPEGSLETRRTSENLRIERLIALRNVELQTPNRQLSARDRLDADFVEAPAAIAAESQRKAGGMPPVVEGSAASTEPERGPSSGGGARTSPTRQDPPAELRTTVTAHRVKANILVAPQTLAETSTDRLAADSRLKTPSDPQTNYVLRDLWLWGNVAYHQDPPPGKARGLDAIGEALVLSNNGAGRMVFNLYHRDPSAANEATTPPHRPVPRARVVTEEMTIEGEEIGVNQVTDQAWVNGPGQITQLTDRGLLTDRAARDDAPETGPNPSSADRVEKESGESPARARPRTRAGRVESEKVALTISWSERMIFDGVSTDPQGIPAARARFFRNVRAEMQDALLYCTRTMTTYTDRPIPLAGLGKQWSSNTAAGNSIRGEDPAADDSEPPPDLQWIELDGKAVAISRKVDPERPILVNLQKLVGDRIVYDRRTGDFQVGGPGMVYLYDRGDVLSLPVKEDREQPLTDRRNVRPTSGPADRRRPAAEPSASRNRSSASPEGANSREASNHGSRPNEERELLQPLILTQIRFVQEMKGRVGTGKFSDRSEPRWAEFFSNVEVARGPVTNERTTFDFDRLPATTYHLTSETLRVVTEQLASASGQQPSARHFLKAWENAYAKTRDVVIQADVITYDSGNDLIYANGEEGRPVIVVRQVGLGQPGSPLRADAVRVNPRTGSADVIGPQALQILDARTGARPRPVAPPDPNAKPKPPPNRLYRTPPNHKERRSFTGR